MEFLMYFVLRRIFVRTEFSRDMITVTRGLIFRRRYDIPLSAVTKIEIRRTPAIRLFRCRRVEVSTLSGGVYFYLHIREEMPFLPEYTGASVRARPLQSAAGAFVDTRAFSGVITFALLLDRTGSVFGSDSFSRIMSAMFGAAEEVRKMLAQEIGPNPFSHRVYIDIVKIIGAIASAADLPILLLLFLHLFEHLLTGRDQGKCPVARLCFCLISCDLC